MIDYSIKLNKFGNQNIYKNMDTHEYCDLVIIIWLGTEGEFQYPILLCQKGGPLLSIAKNIKIIAGGGGDYPCTTFIMSEN